MKLNLIVKDINELTLQETRVLYGLTNGTSTWERKEHGATVGSEFREVLSEVMMKQKVLNTWVIMAEHNDTIIGWCKIKITPSPWRSEADIGFYVNPIYRRLGVGTQLLAQAEELLLQRRIVHVEAHPWNEAGSKFFGSRGFLVQEPYDDYYGGVSWKRVSRVA